MSTNSQLEIQSQSSTTRQQKQPSNHYISSHQNITSSSNRQQGEKTLTKSPIKCIHPSPPITPSPSPSDPSKESQHIELNSNHNASRKAKDMGGTGSFLRSAQNEELSSKNHLESSKFSCSAQINSINRNFTSENFRKDGTLSCRVKRKVPKRYNEEDTSSVEEVNANGIKPLDYDLVSSKQNDGKHVSTNVTPSKKFSQKSVNDKEGVDETSIDNVSSKLSNGLVNSRNTVKVNQCESKLSKATHPDTTTKETDCSETSSPDIIILHDDEANELISRDKDKKSISSQDKLSLTNNERSGEKDNENHSFTKDQEIMNNDTCNDSTLGSVSNSLEKEKRKRGRPPKSKNFSTNRNILDLSPEGKRSFFNHVAGLEDGSNNFNARMSLYDSENSVQKEKRKRGRPKKNQSSNESSINFSPQSNDSLENTFNVDGNVQLRTRSSTRSMNKDHLNGDKLPEDRYNNQQYNSTCTEVEVNQASDHIKKNEYSIRSRRSLQFGTENRTCSGEMMNSSQPSSFQRKQMDSVENGIPSGNHTAFPAEIDDVVITPKDGNSSDYGNVPSMEKCLPHERNIVPPLRIPMNSSEVKEAIEKSDLSKENDPLLSSVIDATNFSSINNPEAEKVNSKHHEETKIQPRIVLKMKKSETGDRWLSQSLSNNTKSKQIIKRRSLIRRMKTRFLCTFSNFIFKCKGNECDRHELFVGKSLFHEIYSDMTIDIKVLLDSMVTDNFQPKDDNSHILFKNWNISHVSLQAALRLCTFMNISSSDESEKSSFQTMVPCFISKALHQLQKKSTVRLTKLETTKTKTSSKEETESSAINCKDFININSYTEHDQQLYMDSSNFSNKPTCFKSKRRKQPTAKLMDSDLSFGTNSCLLASFGSEEDLLNGSSGGSNDSSLQNSVVSPLLLEKAKNKNVELDLRPEQLNLKTVDIEGSNRYAPNVCTLSNEPFKKSKVMPSSTMLEVLKFDRMGRKTKQFIENNSWRFHGKLKPFYRYFSAYASNQNRGFKNLDSETRNHLIRKLNKRYLSWPCKYSDGVVLSSDDDESEFDEKEINLISMRESRHDLNSSNELSSASSLSSNVLYQLHAKESNIDYNIPPAFDQNETNNSKEKQSNGTTRSPNPSPVKSPFKVPQSINIKLKRRRLQDLSSSEENNTSIGDKNTSKENFHKKLKFFIKPYEPRTKKVILARASVPKIPKTDNHDISDIMFNTRNRKQEESPTKHKIRPVRKFAMNSNNSLSSTNLSYKHNHSSNVEKEKNQELDENTATNTNAGTATNGEKAVKKVVKNHAIDMPIFTLAGIVENKPRELEGWFTNKVFQLKKLSSELTNNVNSVSTSNSGNFSYSHYSNYISNSSTANGFVTVNKLCQKNRDKKVDKDNVNVKVKYSEGAYQIKDLDEYKTLLSEKKPVETDNKKETSNSNQTKPSKFYELDNINNCTEDLNIVSLPFNTAETNLLATNLLKTNGLKSLRLQNTAMNQDRISPSPTTSAYAPNNFSELLRVARKIEKISNQGVVKSKVNLRDIPFLPKGWMKVVKRKSFQSEQSPKIKIRTCVEYIDGDGRAFDSLTSAIRFIAREQAQKRQRPLS